MLRRRRLSAGVVKMLALGCPPTLHNDITPKIVKKKTTNYNIQLYIADPNTCNELV